MPSPEPAGDRSVMTAGTRASRLARWQSEWVVSQLRDRWPGLTLHTKVLTTTGDVLLDRPLPEIGGKGLFTAELEQALLSGEIDIAVHSLKDLPVDLPAGLWVGAISPREDPRDVLISKAGWKLMELPAGARVGTSSLRRAAQLKAARPDLTLVALRGNVDTRVYKALDGDYDAVVLASAGVKRLGLQENVTEFLPLTIMLPAPGQGAMAVQCRADDRRTLSLLAAIDHASTRACVDAERTFLSALGGGCSSPVAAFAHAMLEDESGPIELTGLVASVDGQRLIRITRQGSEPVRLGQQLAQDALRQGAQELLQCLA